MHYALKDTPILGDGRWMLEISRCRCIFEGPPMYFIHALVWQTDLIPLALIDCG